MSVPNPRKATSISAVERRIGTEREIGTAMKPTSRLWGTGSSTRGVEPVVGASVASHPSASSATSGPLSSPEASSLTGCPGCR